MKRRLRQRQILDLLLTDPELSVEEACTRLGASPATVRREFVQLAADGRVEKTWGGIRAKTETPATVGPPAFAKRLSENAAEKRAIAQAAAALLADGDVVMIDGGTTTYQLCEFIALKRLRIITNSLVIAETVDRIKRGQRGADVYLTGGILQPESGIVAGPPAEAFLRRYHANWAFLGAAGLDAKSATNYNEAVLASEHLMIEQSSRIAILVDHTKLGQQAMCNLCPVGKIDRVLTGEHKDSTAIVRGLSRAKLEIVTVPVG
ncbi:MAG: DeoR/GlpR family DNA-binding transcription regulator [Chthoniobacteraceae bacterium]